MRWRTAGFVPLIAAGCALSLVACGGDSAGTETPATATAAAVSPTTAATQAAAEGDDALAASMLVTRDDFSRDYLQKQKTDDETATLARACGHEALPGMTGRAVSLDFRFDGESPGISEVVFVFPSEAEAAAAIEAAPQYVDCVLQHIDEGALDADGIVYSGASSTPITVDAPVDEAFAVQVHAAKTTARGGSPAVAQYTLVLAREGRVVFEISSRGTGEPMDVEEISEIVQNAAVRIRQR